MKNSVSTVLFALLAGIAAGWILKSAASSHHDSIRKDPDQAGIEIAPGAASELLEDITRAEETRVTRLAGELNLSPDQRQRLREEFLAPRARAWNAPRELSHPGEPHQQGDASRVPSLGEVLGKILTAQQAADYEQLRRRERRAALQATALHQLAAMTFLDLSPPQRDEIFEILYQSAELATPTGFISPTTGDSLEGAPEAAEGPSNEAPADRRAQIDQDLNRFLPILNPAQRELYRSHLERREPSTGFDDPGSMELPPLVR